MRVENVARSLLTLIQRGSRPKHLEFSLNLRTGIQPSVNKSNAEPALLVFSHLRWDFVTQRPQHLLRRASATREVFYWEEPLLRVREESPVREESQDVLPPEGRLDCWTDAGGSGVTILQPQFYWGEDTDAALRALLDQFMAERKIRQFDLWFYTPMALSFAAHLMPQVTIYDAMDELSAFAGAPEALLGWEQELFRRADVVFTGGHSLFQHKRHQHGNVHAFPSSIERQHFAQALEPQPDPEDQATIPHPRVGFYGVLDERLDIELLGRVATLRPEVHLILLGPVVKIDPEVLPQAHNLHYLGGKSYAELPAYLAGWDAAMLPFAMNESTRFISPTKTPEYLAAGKPVISSPIRDVVHDYGDKGLVRIAATAEAFAEAIDRALHEPHAREWQDAVTAKLDESSWDSTWSAMLDEINKVRPAATVSHATSSTKEMYALRLSNRSAHQYDFMIVGAGFAGAVLAERLASGMGKRVLLVDKRPHIGGNAYDEVNEDGLLVHPYGPHIFHTSSQKVFEYLSQFTEWRSYEHRVLASVDGKLLPIPINLDTINQMYGLDLDAAGMEKFLAERAESCDEIRTSEDVVVSKVGRELYEKFFRNYTRKQWGIDPSQLDSSVAGRIPVRLNQDDRYFSDTFQVMPLEGYTRMFERMLANPKITLLLGTDYREIQNEYKFRTMVYTGPIDEFFDFRFGRLPYRSLQFKHETHDQEQLQTVGVVNYPNDHAYTRITEFKHLTGQEHAKTSIVYEYPSGEGDPYYPIPRPENARVYEMYRELAESTENVYFCGRLANYKYFNMDQVVAQALHLYRNILEDETAQAGLSDAAAPAVLVAASRSTAGSAN